MHTRRWIIGLAVLAMAAAGCGGASTRSRSDSTSAPVTSAPGPTASSTSTTVPEPSSTVPQATEVKTFVAWTAAGVVDPGLHVTGTVSGYCSTDSIAVTSGHAFRCMAGNDIYDPCFAPSSPATSGHVLCASAPWEPEVEIMNLTKPLPVATSAKSPSPWGFQLADGSLCSTVEGAGSDLDGVALSYTCGPTSGGAGSLDTSTEPWTVEYAANTYSGPVIREAVTSAWE